jgi:hypothetical protein
MSAVSIARALHGRKLDSSWTARWLAHDDREPSLSIAVSREGKTPIHCHTGCAQDQVVDALKHTGLWDNGGENQGGFRLRTCQTGHALERQWASSRAIIVSAEGLFRSPQLG